RAVPPENPVDDAKLLDPPRGVRSNDLRRAGTIARRRKIGRPERPAQPGAREGAEACGAQPVIQVPGAAAAFALGRTAKPGPGPGGSTGGTKGRRRRAPPRPPRRREPGRREATTTTRRLVRR